jgi:hypothetical protein
LLILRRHRIDWDTGHDGIFANLVAQLLIHTHDQVVRGLNVAQGGFETATKLGRSADAPTRCQELVNQACLRVD